MLYVSGQRYGTLVHPGDAFSFDIYTHVGDALRREPSLLGGVRPTCLIAVGESQSAMFLTTYVNRNNGFTTDLGVFRLTANGKLDKSFGNNGLAFANIDRQDVPNAIGLDANGKVVSSMVRDDARPNVQGPVGYLSLAV